MEPSMTLNLARMLAPNYKTVPLYKTIQTGGLTPGGVFKTLRGLSRHCFILESAGRWETSGRYTFLGFDPRLELTCQSGKLRIRGGAEFELDTLNPGESIRKIIEENLGPKLPGLPPFTGGLVGYFAYEYIRYAEPKLRLCPSGEEEFRDVDLMLFDKVIAFDRLMNTVILIVNIKTDALEENYARGVHSIAELERIVLTGPQTEPPKLRLLSEFRPLFDRERFGEMVVSAKEHIREGDIFQAVLSNRYNADAQGSLFETYEELRRANPSPYMFYFSSDDVEIAGSAPETLVKLSGEIVTTFPLAGTRPRGDGAESDERLAKELLSDPKELAEHNMLVDLGRNDIGKIAEFGTVKVGEYLSIERFSHVMHIGSTVTGKIRGGLSAVDAIEALLPAGTLSGAPKFRACEIIGELEQGARGIYGGAIGYLALSGDMDTCIAIRIAYKKNGRLYIRSGAGIVADSVPETEFAECDAKLRAVRQAIEKVSGGCIHAATD